LLSGLALQQEFWCILDNKHFNRYLSTDKTIIFDKVVLPGGWTLQMMVEESMALLMQKYGTFAYYDENDLRQEIAIIILRVAEKYDAAKVKNCGKQFYFTCVTRALINLHRDVNAKIVDAAQGGSLIHDLDEELHPVDNSTWNDIMTREIFAYVEMRMPKQLTADFKYMLHTGGEGMTPYKKRQVRNWVKTLIQRYNDE
jgi:hypothetical protein